MSAALRARAFRLRAPLDLLDYYDPTTGFFFEHEGAGLVGVGAALRVEVPPGPDLIARAATAAEAALERIDHDGHLPIVTAALPFDGSHAATLTVPAITIVMRGTDAWMLEIGRQGVPLPETLPHAVAPEPWTSLRVEEDPPSERYVQAVARARDCIRQGLLRKVVLARTLVARSDHSFDVATLLQRLRDVEPHGYVFGAKGFLGATPELLLTRRGLSIETVPLAGTIARAPDLAADDSARALLLGSAKDRHEHGFVVDAVRAALAPVCTDLDVPAEPHTLSTSTVWHLATSVRGTLRAPTPNALALAARLHPTPAVCGTPADRALELIRELEPRARGRSAGVVGWMDASGDGEWAVALRCAEVEGNTARLFAGAGIVAESDPEAERIETDAKFRALLDALGYA